MLSRTVIAFFSFGIVFSLMSCQKAKPTDTGKLEATTASIEKKIIEPRCLRCHSESKHTAGLVLTDLDETMKKSAEKNAKKIIAAGCPEESLLYQKVAAGDMPPSESGFPVLTSNELKILADWIRSQGPACPEE